MVTTSGQPALRSTRPGQVGRGGVGGINSGTGGAEARDRGACVGRPLPPPLRAAGTRATALPRLRPSPTTPGRCFGGFATPRWAGKASVAGWKGEERAVPRRRSPPRPKAKKKKKKLARPQAPPPYLLDPLPALVHALEIGGQHVVLQDHVVKDVHPVDERLHAADALKKRARVVGRRRGCGRGRRASLGGRAHCFLNTQTPLGVGVGGDAVARSRSGPGARCCGAVGQAIEGWALGRRHVGRWRV